MASAPLSQFFPTLMISVTSWYLVFFSASISHQILMYCTPFLTMQHFNFIRYTFYFFWIPVTPWLSRALTPFFKVQQPYNFIFNFTLRVICCDCCFVLIQESFRPLDMLTWKKAKMKLECLPLLNFMLSPRLPKALDSINSNPDFMIFNFNGILSFYILLYFYI